MNNQNLDFTQILQTKSLDYLEALNDFDMEKLKETMEAHPTLTNLKNQKDGLISKTRHQASENLSKEPEMQTSIDNLNNIKARFESNKVLHQGLTSKLNKADNDLNLDNVKIKLQSSQIEANSNCNNLVDQFFDEDIDVSKFVKEYLKAKTLAHSRKLKVDQVTAMMNDRNVQMQQQVASNLGSRSVGYPMRSAPAPPTASGSVYQAYGGYGNYG